MLRLSAGGEVILAVAPSRSPPWGGPPASPPLCSQKGGSGKAAVHFRFLLLYLPASLGCLDLAENLGSKGQESALSTHSKHTWALSHFLDILWLRGHQPVQRLKVVLGVSSYSPQQYLELLMPDLYLLGLHSSGQSQDRKLTTSGSPSVITCFNSPLSRILFPRN